MPAPSVDDVVARLRARGVRMTTPRRAVLDALLAAGSHVTADELHRRVAERHPDTSPSSVYRTLDLLTDHGIVDHVHLGHGPAQYHLATERHAHLVCDTCGGVLELDADLAEPFIDAVVEATGFRLDMGHFALTGWCAACAESETDAGR